MIFIEIKNHRGTCISFMEHCSDLGARGEETAFSEICGSVSVFGIRGQGRRIVTCLQVFLLFQLSEKFMSPFFIGNAETDLPARAER